MGTAERTFPQQSIRDIVVFESGTWTFPGAGFSPSKDGAALLGGLGGLITGAVVGSILNPRIGYLYLPWDTTYAIRDDISLEDIHIVTLDRVFVGGTTYFTRTIGKREYRFNKAEATYSWKRTSSGVS